MLNTKLSFIWPKYRRDYQVTFQSPPPSKIPEGLPGHSPVAASLQNTGGITSSQSIRCFPPKYRRDYQVTVQLLPPSKIPEELPGHSPVVPLSHRRLPAKYQRDYQVTVQLPPPS